MILKISVLIIKFIKLILKNYFVTGITTLIFKNHSERLNPRLSEHRRDTFMNLGAEFRTQDINDEISLSIIH